MTKHNSIHKCSPFITVHFRVPSSKLHYTIRAFNSLATRGYQQTYRSEPEPPKSVVGHSPVSGFVVNPAFPWEEDAAACVVGYLKDESRSIM